MKHLISLKDWSAEEILDVLALATDVVNWGDAVKKRWAYGYDWPDKAGC